MGNRNQNGYQSVLLHENIGLLERAIDALREALPDAWRAFELREIYGMERNQVRDILGVRRLATVNDRVNKARQFLISVLPPREDLF